MKKVLRYIDIFIDWTGKIFGWSIVVFTLLVVFEVIMRYVFNRPTIWSFEICIMLYSFHFMFLAAYALRHNAHVSVDFFFERLSKRGQAVLSIICYLIFFFPFVIVVFIEGWEYAADSWAMRETSWSAFGPPVYPWKMLIPVSAFLLFIQGFSIFVKRIFELIKRRPTNA